MSEVDTNPTDNEAVSGKDAQQLTSNEGGEQHAPSTLEKTRACEKTRAWTREHPFAVAVGAVAAGAVVTAGVLTLGSSEEKQGTTITTTQEVENPDGSREITVEETFIPEEPIEEISPTSSTSENPTENEVENGLITNLSRYIEEPEFNRNDIVENEVTSYLENVEEGEVGLWKNFVMFYRGAIVMPYTPPQVRDGRQTMDNAEVFVRLENPALIPHEDSIFLIAHNKETDSYFTKYVGTFDPASNQISNYQFVFSRESDFLAIEGQEFSGKMSVAQPIELKGDGFVVRDEHSYSFFDRGTYRYTPRAALYGTYEAAIEGLGGEPRSLNEDNEFIYSEFYDIESRD